MIHKTLPNGIEVLVDESHFSRMVAIQCWVGVGSICENEEEFGLSHVLEHMLFKGTKQRGVGEISSLVEGFGGDINAFTTFDQTVYYLTLTSQYVSEGLELLSDAIFNSSFDEKELTLEKEVILEEIRQGNDSPGQVLGRKVFEELYKGTPASRPIIGFTESVQGFTRDDLCSFHKKWYQPNNMKVVVYGAIDSDFVFSQIQKYFGARQAGYLPEVPRINLSPRSAPEVQVISGNYHQTRLEISFPGPSQDDFQLVDTDLAAFALGSGDSSRLNKKVRDELSLVSSIGCSTYSPKFGGIIGVSAIPEPGKVKDALRAISTELVKICSTAPIQDDEINRALINLKADKLYLEGTVSGKARSLGSSLQSIHKTLSDVVYESKASAANAQSVTRALRRWLDPQKVIISVLGPEGESHDKEELLKIFQEEFKADRVLGERKNQSVVRSNTKEIPQVFNITNGLKLVYRKTEVPTLFSANVVTDGGLRADQTESAGLQNAISSMLSCGTQHHSYEEIVRETEGRGGMIVGFSGKDSLGLKLQCFEEDKDFLGKIWRDSILYPKFPEQQWDVTKAEILEDMRHEQDSPANRAIRKFQKEIYKKHPYSQPLYGNWDFISSLSCEDLESSFLSYRDQGRWTIGAVGNSEPEEIVAWCEELFSSWGPTDSSRVFTLPEVVSDTSDRFSLTSDREQSHIIYGGTGLNWFSSDRYALDVLSTILGGSGGRLFLKLRDQKGLAYSVTPLLSYGCEKGTFGAYLACSPSKVNNALEALREEFDLISSTKPLAEELERAKNYLIGSHEVEMQRADAQAMTMALMETYGLGYKDFMTYSDKVGQVSSDDVVRVASQLLCDNSLLTVVTGPDAVG